MRTEGRQSRRRVEPERARQALGLAVRHQTRQRITPQRVVAARLARVGAAVAGRLLDGVVGGRGAGDEGQAIAVVVRIEQRGKVSAALRVAGHGVDAEHYQHVDAVLRHRGRQRQAQRHAFLLGGGEVDHPAHAGIDGEVAVRWRGSGSGARTDAGAERRLARQRQALRMPDHLAVCARHREPALRQQPRPRRVAPAIGTARGARRHGGEARRARPRGIRPGGVGGLEPARDPGRARGVEAIGQLLPGGAPLGLVGASQPGLLPEVPAPFDLRRRQLALMGIDVDLVGKDADAQLLRAVGLGKEARLQAHRQQRQRLVARQQRCRQFTRHGLRRKRQQRGHRGQRQRHRVPTSRRACGRA